MKRRVLSLLMILSVMTALAAEAAFAAETQLYDAEMEQLVRTQFTAYATALNTDYEKNNGGDSASSKALNAMLSSALSAKGDIVMDEDDAMTVAILNSTLYMTTLPRIVTAALEQMHDTHESVVYLRGSAGWYDYRYSHTMSTYADDDEENEERIGYVYSATDIEQDDNSNDRMLELVAGSTYSRITIKEAGSAGANRKTYDIRMKMFDSFDFDGDYSGVEDAGYDASTARLLTMLGKVLGLNTFDWSVEAAFSITVPDRQECGHGAAAYSWSYDGVTQTLTSLADGEFDQNTPTRFQEENSAGTLTSHFKLEHAVELYHDKPWTVEITAKGNGNLVFATRDNISSGHPFLVRTYARRTPEEGAAFYEYFLWGGKYSVVDLTDEEKEELGTYDTVRAWRDYYGADYTPVYNSNQNKELTYRLENVIAADGSNMAYLFVGVPDANGELTWTEGMPMVRHYITSSELSGEDQGDTADWFNGKDFFISFIGNKNYRMSSTTKSIRIWEGGKTGDKSHLSGVVTKPTETTAGYTTYHCPDCGETFRDDYIEAHAHAYEKFTFHWSKDAPVTVSSACTICGEGIEKNCRISYAVEDGRFAVVASADVGGKTATDRQYMEVEQDGDGFVVRVPAVPAGVQILAAAYDSGRMTGLTLLGQRESGAELRLLGEQVRVFAVDAESKAPLCKALEK